MMKGNNHKPNCTCRFCTGKAGFQKGNDVKGKNNPMFGVDRKGKCSWVAERNKKMVGALNSFFGHKHTKKTKLTNREKHINPPESTRIKLRIARQKQILKNGGGPNIGKNETAALNKIEEIFKIKIIRQYLICGYFVDGYCKSTNTVFEIDEKHHECNRKQDRKRQTIIENKLKCKFVRIQDYE